MWEATTKDPCADIDVSISVCPGPLLLSAPFDEAQLGLATHARMTGIQDPPGKCAAGGRLDLASAPLSSAPSQMLCLVLVTGTTLKNSSPAHY